MDKKILLKHLMGKIQCWINGIQHSGEIYIGKNVHIVNGKKIRLGRACQIRPECDLYALDMIEIGNRCDIGTRNRIVGNVVIEDSVLLGPDNYISFTDHCYQNINVPIMDQGAYIPDRNGHKELKIGGGKLDRDTCGYYR